MYIQHYTTIYSGILSDILFWNSICSCPGPAHSVWSSRYELPRRAGTEVDEKRRRGEGGEGEDELHLCDLETLTWKVGKNHDLGPLNSAKPVPRVLPCWSLSPNLDPWIPPQTRNWNFPLEDSRCWRWSTIPELLGPISSKNKGAAKAAPILML